MSDRIDWNSIENKWINKWDEQKLFQAEFQDIGQYNGLGAQYAVREEPRREHGAV